MNLLITGGTGSLGQAVVKKLLCNLVIEFDKIYIFSRDEQKQDAMARKFLPMDRGNRLRFVIGDVRDKDRLRLLFTGSNITHIIHAAALKIVPAMEYNPIEAVKTNVLGTQNLIEVVCEHYQSVNNVLAVSTDKAVNPINLYGATKLTMEKLILSANNLCGEMGPMFGVVRYGNVTGSRGSVIPYIKECVRNNKTVNITDPTMTRFWITLGDAADFVINSLYQMNGQDKLFVPKMKAYKLSKVMRAMNVTNSICVGKRPGEKSHEAILTDDELVGKYKLYPQYSSTAVQMTKKELIKGLKDEGWL